MENIKTKHDDIEKSVCFKKRKSLSEMSLEELWRLFPISLTEHQVYWKNWYRDEKDNIEKILNQIETYRISHIGSTSIDIIWAKPIIYILVEIPRQYDMEEIKKQLVGNGYICMSQSFNRISFNKGYTDNGFAEKVFHLHLRYTGDNDELYFRDYLIEHQDVARQYEELKLKLWKKYQYNRDEYTNAKTEFIKEYTQKAKKEYGKRYE